MQVVDEDADEEEVVVLGDVDCATMRAGAALWAAAAFAAATAGRMEGMFSGRGLGAGAGWARPLPGGPAGRSSRQRWAGEARGCVLRLLGTAGLGSCNA